MIADAPKPVAPYSHVVEKDGWLFVTGQLATDPAEDALPIPDGIEAQTHKVMDNLVQALRGAGAGLEHVVCALAFLVHFERDYAAFNRIYAGYSPRTGCRRGPPSGSPRSPAAALLRST